ncbi:hypothetical protein [Paraburkholderia sediminicola]|uniref:hypothetical protein n=1 Tax=Paraburkholderia sediminicola TaxID=458836 RepID=UPI0038BDBF71
MERFLSALMVIGSGIVSGSMVAWLVTTPAAPAVYALAATGVLWIVGDSVRDMRQVRKGSPQ